jgi:hypothetical protein
MKSKHDDMSAKHWQERPEAKWEAFQFNQPYAKGLSRLMEVLSESNFDPATLWQWGTMQALAVIEILKSVEREFGRKGQQVIFESLKRVGYEVARQVTDGTSIPKDMSNAEWVSFFTTVMNRIAYSSLESPRIEEDDKISFHIDWCPHQDHYQAMDCRVQRYLVQGMIDAGTEFLKGQGREEAWDMAFKTTIPAGGQTCHFEVERGDPQASRKWAEYTRQLEDKALAIAAKGAQEKGRTG